MQYLAHPVTKFAASLLAMAVVWFVWLPRLSQHPDVQQRLDWLDERGIDPSAMYYTELDLKWSSTTTCQGKCLPPPMP